MSKRRVNGSTDTITVSPSEEKLGFSSLVKKALTTDSSWEDKDSFLDIIYWVRQIFALFNGLAWGFIPLTGILGLALFLVINCALVYIYVSRQTKIDEDDFGGIQELVKEGLFTAFAVFLISWIMVYTSLYG